MNYYLFINKHSGQGNSSQKFTYLKTKLSNDDRLAIYETTTSNEMIAILREHFDDIDILIFAGGDGTIREALRYCYKHKVTKPIGLIPAGTGNDYIRSLKIPVNIEAAIDIIMQGRTVDVRAVAFNNDFYFNIASVGLDAEIVVQQKKMRRYFQGASSYFLSALYKMIVFSPKSTRLYIDDVEITDKYILIAVANGQYYGGGMKIAPNGDVTDDKLRIYCAKKMTKYKIPYYFALMQKGDHKNLKNVDYYECNHLVIKSECEVAFNLDGDILIGNYADIKIKNDHTLKIFSSLN